MSSSPPTTSPSASAGTDSRAAKILLAQDQAKKGGFAYPSIEPSAPSSITIKHALSTEQYAELVDKIKGVIFGNAIGDAVGAITEFSHKDQIRIRYEIEGAINYPQHSGVNQEYCSSGDWTDDTDQLILILDMLLATGGLVDIQDFATRLKYWVKHGFTELGDQTGFGTGSTVLAAVIQPHFESNPASCATHVYNRSNGSKASNGAVMRTSILGCVEFHDLTTLINNTVKIATTTHQDPRSVAAALVCTLIIAFQLQNCLKPIEQRRSEDQIIEEAVELAISASLITPTSASPPLWETQHRPEWIQSLRSSCSASTSLQSMQLSENGIGYAYKTIGAGVYCYRHGTTFRESITTLILEGGDTDTNAAVAGALLGCKLGYGRLDGTWLNGLMEKEWLEKRVNRFLQLLGV